MVTQSNHSISNTFFSDYNESNGKFLQYQSSLMEPPVFTSVMLVVFNYILLSLLKSDTV